MICFYPCSIQFIAHRQAAAKGLQSGMGPKRKNKKAKGKEASPEVAAS